MEAHTPNQTRAVGRAKEFRVACGKTQFTVALESNTSINTVARVEAGLIPRKDTPELRRIAEALGVTVEELRG